MLKFLIICLIVVGVSAQYYPVGHPYFYNGYFGQPNFVAPLSHIYSPPLATITNVVPTIITSPEKSVDLTVANPTCDCNIVIGSPNGCKISKAAPPGYYCQCSLNGLSCSGTAKQCYIDHSDQYYCMHPDTSISSCLYSGYGNCDGYSAPHGCSCKYRSGGCYINTPAPPFFACRCSYVGFWTCSGSVILNNEGCQGYVFAGSYSCLNPGTSKSDCQIAIVGTSKPDCGGY